MKSPRELAVLTLSACETEHAWAGAYLSAALSAENLSPRDSGLALHLCYGVLRRRMELDFYLAHFCKMPLSKLESKTRNSLRMGAFQLLFMDKIPPSAAVNESVGLTRKYAKNPRAPGLVNGVLRSMERQKTQLPPLPKEPLPLALATEYSHPTYIVEDLLSRLGEKEARAVLSCNNQEAPVTLQINTLRCDQKTALDALEARGKGTVSLHPFLPGCIRLSSAGAVQELPFWQEGGFWIQDPAARMAILAADPKKGDRVLDACSAPGGKSFAAAVQMKDQGEILSCDISERKLQLVSDGARRLGLTSIKTQVQDAGIPPNEWSTAFDLVVADLPCSGLGVIRKKPDVRYRSEASFSQLPQVQLRLLSALAECVKPGGTLLYSTCTVRREENEDVMYGFLKENEEFALSPFSLPIKGGEEGYVTIWPHLGDTDGFFIARMVRRR